MINASLEIDFVNKFLDFLVGVLDKAFGDSTTGIAVRVGEMASEYLRQSPAFQSLVDGKLFHELGVVSAEPILRQVIENVKNGVLVENLGVRRAGDSISGGLKISFLKGDYSECLSVQGTSFISHNRKRNTTNLVDWFRWLTLGGDIFLVKDFKFEAGHHKSSRTGDGIMVEGGNWRVPPEFAGIEGDNWMTRALMETEPEISKIIQEEIQKRL